ncbi:class I SAM-dependent methyltransferase [Nakamurella deserti]|uniref:class I SAM-dependent methyltransferase n=1 Tax=Nakamurella deserti TaxID=2164074 RepID=UPI000DBE6C39|nr:class I SAM-dependent methyltransferase [Nakamurella deserti]
MADTRDPTTTGSRGPAVTPPSPVTGPGPATDAPAGAPATADRDYAERLERLQGKWWKKLLRVQLPWQLHLRALRLGRTLDVGCGTGRNLGNLPAGSVGVDHNPHSVAVARAAGGDAHTDVEFFADPAMSAPGGFDALLAAHLVEHLTPAEARTVLGSYLPALRPGGRLVLFTPQERGYASDPTHVVFSGFDELTALCADLGLQVARRYSFPFPRWTGKLFVYNEFVVIARVPTS